MPDRAKTVLAGVLASPSGLEFAGLLALSFSRREFIRLLGVQRRQNGFYQTFGCRMDRVAALGPYLRTRSVASLQGIG